MPKLNTYPLVQDFEAALEVIAIIPGLGESFQTVRIPKTVLTEYIEAYAGHEVEMQKGATHIQWRYVGDPDWIDLISLEDMKGEPVELRKTATHIQWKYQEDALWMNLVPLLDITGPTVNPDWLSSSGLSEILNKPTLGTASAEDVGYFATSGQGAKADTAVQPAELAPYALIATLNDYALKTSVPDDTDDLPEGATNKYISQAELDKLAGLESSHFKGLYASYAELVSTIPSGVPGDYADVDEGSGHEIARYIWDNSDNAWIRQAGYSPALTPPQIKIMYESNPNTNAFTDGEKSKLTGIANGATANATDAQLRSRATHTGTQSVSTITGLATVATSGSYADLENKPVIPDPQVNVNWNSVSGITQILNKPILGTAAYVNTTTLATASQGLKADTAVQPEDLASVSDRRRGILGNVD